MHELHVPGSSVILFFVSTIFLSLACHRMLLLLEKKNGQISLPGESYYWALNGPVLFSAFLALFAGLVPCCHGDQSLLAEHRAIIPYLFGFSFSALLILGLFMALSKTLWRVRAAGKKNRMFRTIRENPSPKLSRALKKIKKVSGISFPCYEISSDEPISATLGWFRPWMVISSKLVNRLSVEELEGILWHEFYHGVRRDNLKRIFSFFSAQLFGLFPWARALSEKWEATVEFSCDRFAVCQTRRPQAMASALARAACEMIRGRSEAPLSSSFSQNGSNVMKRVKAVLDPEKNQPFPLWKLLSGGAFLGVAWVCFLTRLDIIPSLWCFVSRLSSHLAG